MEITQHKQVGSDVSEVLQNDHALAAEEFLKQAHFYDWQVVVADDNKLMLDYDQKPFDGGLPEHLYDVLGILEQAVGCAVYMYAAESKGGNTHVVILLPRPMPIVERIAWQAAFGSDPKREALHLLSVSRNELNPILLFMRKDRQTTGVDTQGNSIVQCSHYIATPQKLLEAGVPQNLLGDGNAG